MILQRGGLRTKNFFVCFVCLFSFVCLLCFLSAMFGSACVFCKFISSARTFNNFAKGRFVDKKLFLGLLFCLFIMFCLFVMFCFACVL